MKRDKTEAAADVSVSHKTGNNEYLASMQSGSIGGQMVKKMIESYERGFK